MTKRTAPLGLYRETVRELTEAEAAAAANRRMAASILTCPCIPSSLPVCHSC